MGSCPVTDIDPKILRMSASINASYVSVNKCFTSQYLYLHCLNQSDINFWWPKFFSMAVS